MAIEIKACIRRLAGNGVGLLMVALSVFGAAAAGQAPVVTTGSVVTIPSDSSWGQIYKILFYKGNVLALDAANDALYQLSPGATAWSTLVTKKTTIGAGYSSQGMTMDAAGNLYITIAYPLTTVPNALFWRVPYSPSDNTWHVTTSNGWGSNIVDDNGTVISTEGGSVEVGFQNSPKMDGSGTLYWMATTPNILYSAPVDNTGNATQSTVMANNIVGNLKATQGKMAIDVSGNIYFTENHADTNLQRSTGIFFISAAQAASGGIVGANGTAETQLVRIDSAQASVPNPIVYAGVTLDEAGNLYLTSENNANYNETVNGIWEIPNECAPGAVTAANVQSCLNWNNISLLAPFSGNNPVAIDSRGYIWDPTYQDPSPTGSGPYPGVYGILVWAPGSLNLSAEPTGTTAPWITNVNPTFGEAGASVTIAGLNFGSTQGTSTVAFNGTTAASITNWSNTSITAAVPAGATTGPVVVTAGGTASNSVAFTVGAAPLFSTVGTLFVNFNQAVTPSAFSFSQIGTGTDFVNVQTNPDPASPPAATSPQCTTTPATTYAAQSSCQIWVGLNARAPGAISGQLTISGTVGTSTQNEVIPGSTVYLSGTGQGAEVAILDSPAQTMVAAEPQLQTPAQVASDPQGDAYIADSGLKEVLKFAANSISGTGTSIGSGLAGPTGVAVDGTGDVYIADNSGKVIEIPAVNGVANPAGQTTIASGLGKNLNLAVDGLGDVYVADPNNARIVKIANPAATDLITNSNTLGVNASTIVTVGSGFTKPSAVAVDNSGNLFVADGANLYEVTPWSVQTDITSSLSAPVTGLAVDASGSVIVSQSGGLLRIPSIGGSLQVNSAGPMAGNITTPVTAPGGVALDQSGNLYVSDMTGGTPNLWELAVNGAINFGQGLTPTLLTEQDVPLFDIGNESLTVTGVPQFSGSNAAYFSVVAPSGGTACDTTGVASVATGSSCTLGLGFTPPAPPAGDTSPTTYTGGMTVPTNAGNVPSGTLAATLVGTALAGQEVTQTTVALTPASSTYRGSTTATVTIIPVPGNGIDYATNVPSGTVTLTLTSTVVGSTQPPIVKTAQATGTDAGTSATFTLTDIQGGSYSVTAAYGGNIAQLMQKSQSSAVTFTVAPAPPTITLSEPLGVSANPSNGIYYVENGRATITLTANVSSLLGTPTGTVTFMNGSQVVGTEAPDANGNAVFSTKPLALGSYNLTAVYSGDQNFATATSKAIAFQDILSSVLITASPASVSTPAGAPVASTITLQSLAGFSATNGANLTCVNSTLPYYSECTFSVPNPVICAPSGTCTGIVTSVLTISSNIPVNLPPAAAANVLAHGAGTSPLIPAGLFGFGLFGLALRRRAIFNRKLLNGVSLGLLLMGVVMGFGGCTNNSYTKTPPAQKYTTPSGTYKVSIVVTDPSSGATESLPFTLGLTIQ